MGPDEEFLEAIGYPDLTDEQKRIADEALGRKRDEGDRIHKQAELYISAGRGPNGEETLYPATGWREMGMTTPENYETGTDGVPDIRRNPVWIDEIQRWEGLIPLDETNPYYLKEPWRAQPHIQKWHIDFEIKGLHPHHPDSFQRQRSMYDLFYGPFHSKRHCGHIPRHASHTWTLGSGLVKVTLACLGMKE